MILSKLDSSSWSYRICRWCLISRSFCSVFPCTDTAASNSSNDLDWCFQQTDRRRGGRGGPRRKRNRWENITRQQQLGGGSFFHQSNRECPARARQMDRLLTTINPTVAINAKGRCGSDRKQVAFSLVNATSQCLTSSTASSPAGKNTYIPSSLSSNPDRTRDRELPSWTTELNKHTTHTRKRGELGLHFHPSTGKK